MKLIGKTLCALMLGSIGPVLAQPRVTAVVNAASYEPAVPRGCLVSIFGTGLARSAVSATSLPLPKRLEDTVVRVGDVELEAPLYFVSRTQINAQLPFEVLGERISVVVTTAEGRSPPFVLTPAAAGPGIFTREASGKGRALVFNPAFQPLDVVVPGEPMILYAAGLGPTNPPVLSGNPGATAEPLNRVVTVPEVFVGDAPAQVTVAGLAPGLAGVYQLNVVPQSLITDRVLIRSRGRPSNAAEVGIRGGQNVSNASGTIEALYPQPEPDSEPIAFSQHLLVARFTARFDIAPSAGPFTVEAYALSPDRVLSEGPASSVVRSVVRFDPANGGFEGDVTLPTTRSRNWDFSGTEIAPIFDLIPCVRAPDGIVNCLPFPGAHIPLSRVSFQEVQALRMLPLPDTDVAGSATGLLRVRGQARAGSTFTINAENNGSLSVFAGYIAIPIPPQPSRTVALKLFIDGNPVASTEVRYRVRTIPL